MINFITLRYKSIFPSNEYNLKLFCQSKADLFIKDEVCDYFHKSGLCLKKELILLNRCIARRKSTLPTSVYLNQNKVNRNLFIAVSNLARLIDIVESNSSFDKLYIKNLLKGKLSQVMYKYHKGENEVQFKKESDFSNLIKKDHFAKESEFLNLIEQDYLLIKD